MTFEDDTLESFRTRIYWKEFSACHWNIFCFRVIFWPPCFALVKEDREATEGTGNPAFNMSSPDLLAHQTSDKRVIRHDMPGHTLAAHRQKFGLLASAEPKGVTSVLIIFIVTDSCCTCDLTGASWSRHQAFHSSVSAQASWLWMEHGGHT